MTIPQLVAHRGYPDHFPENTLIGIAAAIRAGARLVEIDVQLSADEVPVLVHDHNLQRVAGFKGTVHHLSYDQLYEIHPSEFERFGYRYAQVRIPTLAEFCKLLQKWPGVTAFVELKSTSIDHFGPALVLNRVLRDIEAVASQDGHFVGALSTYTWASPREKSLTKYTNALSGLVLNNFGGPLFIAALSANATPATENRATITSGAKPMKCFRLGISSLAMVRSLYHGGYINNYSSPSVWTPISEFFV